MKVRTFFQSKVASKFGKHAEEIMEHFDSLVARFGEAQALNIMLEACMQFRQQLQQANASTGLPLSPRAESIRSQLEIANKSRLVETNSILRLREIIARLRQNIGKCGALIDGKEISKSEIPLPEVPACLRGGVTTYSATASLRGGKQAKLSIEISG